jgi:hypothetical protein
LYLIRNSKKTIKSFNNMPIKSKGTGEREQETQGRREGKIKEIKLWGKGEDTYSRRQINKQKCHPNIMAQHKHKSEEHRGASLWNGQQQTYCWGV